jgi:transcriptional regulator with XRE-family HTH domain
MGTSVPSALRTIGDNILDARNAIKIDQSELASRCGTTPPTVHKWEQNKSVPDLASLFKVAVACETTIERLVMGVDPAYTAWIESRPTAERITALAGMITESQQNAALAILLEFAGRSMHGHPHDHP